MPNRQNAIVLHGNDSQLPTLVPSKLPGLSVWYVQVIFPRWTQGTGRSVLRQS